TQRLADIAAVRIRKPDVDHERIGKPGRHPFEQLVGRPHRADVETLGAEAAYEHVPKLRVVLQQKQLRGRHAAQYPPPGPIATNAFRSLSGRIRRMTTWQTG